MRRFAASNTPYLNVVGPDHLDDLSRALVRGHAGQPILCFRNPSRHHIDSSVLVRLGDGVAEGRRARDTLRKLLAQRIGRAVAHDKQRYVITSMPERFQSETEHTFVSFVRSLAQELDIEFVNDRFVETGPRCDVTELAPHERAEMLTELWQFQGDLMGRTAILLDDVLGTGASLGVAGDVLRAAGAQVVPIALVKLEDEDGEMERAVHQHFGARCSILLELPEVRGSLRRSIEQWCANPAWATSRYA